MRRFGHLLAACAMALHALWPLIAQAKPKAVELVPVCTVGGVTHYTEVPLGSSPLEQKSATHHEHCAFCSFGGERAVLQSDVPYFASPISPTDSPVRGFEQVVFKKRNANPARSRAPPVFLSVHPSNDDFRRTYEEATALLARGACAGDADSGRGVLRLGLLLD